MNPEIINYHIGAKIGLKKKEEIHLCFYGRRISILLPLEYISFRKGGFIQIFYGKSIFYSIRIFYLEGTNFLRQNAELTRQKNLPGSIYSRHCCLVLLALRHQQQQVRPRQCKSRRREANENIETELEVF